MLENRTCYFSIVPSVQKQYLVDLLPLPVEWLPDRDDARYLVDVERLPVAVGQLLEPVAHLAVQADVGVASAHFHDAAAQGGVLEEKQGLSWMWFFLITETFHLSIS